MKALTEVLSYLSSDSSKVYLLEITLFNSSISIYLCAGIL